MKQTRVEGEGEAEFDADLFSPEELAMMSSANGATNPIASPADPDDLQAQIEAVARLVAEGGERERQLRALINDLTVLARTSEAQQRSIYDQSQTLARLVVSGSKREVKLQESLVALREVAMVRARSVF